MRRSDHPNGVRTWHFDMDGPGLLAAVTSRRGGHSAGPYAGLNLGFHVGDDPAAVAANRSDVCAALGLDALTVADQQHGRRVSVVGPGASGAGHGSLESSRLEFPATDGLVTAVAGVALAVLVADCAPVVLYDPVERVLAVAHAGRAGAVCDVIGATVRVMSASFGTEPGDIRAGIGPCIGRRHYEIGPPQLEQARHAFPGGGMFTPTPHGRALFDLEAAVLERLEQAGVDRSRVESSGSDTYACREEFFSDRVARPCGRFMLVAALLAE